MLYKFKSAATGDVIMLEPNGRQILNIIGKSVESPTAEPGIIIPEHIPAAIAALERAVAEDQVARAAAKTRDAGSTASGAVDTISLHQRALPFLQMLRRCEAAGEKILWGI